MVFLFLLQMNQQFSEMKMEMCILILARSRKMKNPPINRLLDVNSVKLCNYFRLSIITLVHCQNANHTYQAIHQNTWDTHPIHDNVKAA